MCGLVGGIIPSAVTLHQMTSLNEIMYNLLYVSTLRGMHSTGIYTLCHYPKNDKGEYKYFLSKKAVPGDYFIESEDYKRVAKSYSNAKVIIGHTRHATIGEISEETAHPFALRHVALAHNGTLHNWQSSLPNWNKGPETDSYRIASAMQKLGSSTDTIEKFGGAYALTWYDHRHKTMFLARNDERPLFYGVIEIDANKFGLFWASDEWMLHAGVQGTYGSEVIKTYNLEVGDMLRIPLDFDIVVVGTNDQVFLERTTVETFKPKSTYRYSHPYETIYFPKSSHFSSHPTSQSTVHNGSIKAIENELRKNMRQMGNLGYTFGQKLDCAFLKYVASYGKKSKKKSKGTVLLTTKDKEVVLLHNVGEEVALELKDSPNIRVLVFGASNQNGTVVILGRLYDYESTSEEDPVVFFTEIDEPSNLDIEDLLLDGCYMCGQVENKSPPFTRWFNTISDDDNEDDTTVYLCDSCVEYVTDKGLKV